MPRRQMTLGEFLTDASFWRPEFLSPPRDGSAWIEHAPFAFWLVQALRPNVVVELGTHTGFSYLTICQAIERLGLPTRASAIDTWEGDPQTGAYGPEVFEELAAQHDVRFGSFSTLLRSSFDDAVEHFEDGSIELLHIDGYHEYESVRHDFEAWRPKLAADGVVLLHDTNVREPTYGVHRLWHELRREHPGFELLHGNGLGILGMGDGPVALTPLFAANDDPTLAASIRSAYAHLGRTLTLEVDLASSGSRLADTAAQLQERDEALAALRQQQAALRQELEAEQDARRAAQARITEEQRALRELQGQLDQVLHEAVEWRRVQARSGFRLFVAASRVRTILGPAGTARDRVLRRGLRSIASTVDRFTLAGEARVGSAPVSDRAAVELVKGPLAMRYGHVRHARILARRTKEVYADEGALAVARRAWKWAKKRPEVGQRRLVTQGEHSAAIEARYARWRERSDPDDVELERQRGAAASLPFHPLFSVVVPVFDPPLDVLRQTVDSVLNQTYGRFELCVANAGRDRRCASYLEDLASEDPRVRVKTLPENRGISGNSNEALALASGDFVALLDHDDLLAPHALFAIAEALNRDPDLDVLYSDEDRLAPDGTRILPFLKPHWSPEFLHSYMWTGHLTVYRRSLVESLGGFRSEYDGSQDYDLMLRAAAATDRIAHVPQVLYHWRMIQGSAAAGGKRDARRSNLAALGSAIAERGLPARIAEYPFANRVVFALVERPLVSIIVPTDNLENARACVRGILAKTSYDEFEILLITNSDVARSLEDELGTSVRCIRYDGQFNFSRKCNLGASEAEGEYLLFLNDDVEPITEAWIESMLQYAQLPEIGGVSPKLLYPDETIQYAGLVTGVRDVVGTAFHTWPRWDGSYHSMAISLRNVSCLNGACMLVRAADLQRVGGWDETNTPITHSDFDLSFRLQEAGLRLVYTPFAELRHHGHVSRRRAIPDPSSPITRADRGADVYLLRHWGPRIVEDPFYTEGMRELLYEHEGDYRIVAPRSTQLHDAWWERPRVLLVGHELSSTGAPLMMVEVARALERAGMLVTVTAADGGQLVERCVENGIPVVLDADILRDPRAAARFLSGFDVVGANTVLTWRAVRLAESMGIPAVWMIQESRFGLAELTAPDARATFREATQVIFPSRETAELYASFGEPGRHRSIHYGIPDAAAEAAPAVAFERRDRAVYITHVGSLEERKGADVLLQAIRRLPAELVERLQVLVIGRPLDAEYVARLRAGSSRLNVQFVGSVPRAQVLAYVRDSDIFVCTSRDESGPLVVIEAMALGKPIVSTTVGAAGEIIRPGIDGELVAVDDVDALAEKIVQLAEDPESRARLGREARATFERSLTAEHYAKQIVDVFREALGGAPADVARATAARSGR